MKKAKWALATLLAFVFGLLCLAACGAETGMAGTYYFVSVQMQTGAEMKEYGIGDTLPSGIVAKKDTCSFHLKSDGGLEMIIGVEGQNMDMSGTWEAVEGEPNKITITIEESPLICECDGSTIVMTPPGNLYILTLKK